MKNLILFLSVDHISGRLAGETTASLEIEGIVFSIEEQYFGDWILIRDEDRAIVGFKLVPLVGNDYLETRFLKTGFVTQARNVRIERGDDIYITIYLAARDNYYEDPMNRIEASVLRAASGEVVVRLDGFTDDDINQFDFKIE